MVALQELLAEPEAAPDVNMDASSMLPASAAQHTAPAAPSQSLAVSPAPGVAAETVTGALTATESAGEATRRANELLASLGRLDEGLDDAALGARCREAMVRACPY